MDADRFDGWAKVLAGGVSRRRVLRRVGRVLAGALAPGRVSGAAAADCTGRCTRLSAGAARDRCQAACVAAGQARAAADEARARAAELRACGDADAPCDTDDRCCPGLVCGTDGTCQSRLGSGDGECPPGTIGACRTAAGTAGRCCNGSCCPSACQCSVSFNGAFCYSGRRAIECEINPKCDVAGVNCDCVNGLCSCYEIPCHNNPSICPSGSQCTANQGCEELCRAH